MNNLVSVTDALGGIATRQQLVSAGCTGFDLTRAVRMGAIRRVRQARYATDAALPDAVVATRVGGLLAGISAANSYGLWSGFDTRVHVSVGQNSSRLRTNVPPSLRAIGQDLSADFIRRRVCVHWLREGAVPELGPECWRVPVEVCLRQVVEWADRETAIACLDTALTIRKLRCEDIAHIFSASSAAERLIAAQCDYGCDSGTESLVGQRLLALGIQMRRQVHIPGVGRVDIGIVGTRIIIEVDSKGHHDNPRAFEEDRRRDAELVSRNYIVIRLSYLKVTGDWPWCVRVVLAAIRGA